MPSDRPTAAAVALALVVCVLVIAGVAATPGAADGESLTVAAPEDSRWPPGLTNSAPA